MLFRGNMNKKIFFLISLILTVFFGCQTNNIKKPTTPQDLIREGQIEQAKGLFLTPNDINSPDEDGNTVLHLAAQINDTDLISYFIFKGADTELKNFESETPLHVAINNGCVDAARTLYTLGSNIFARNKDGITALDLGLLENDSYYDIFINTKSGEIRDTEGKSIVHYFVQTKNLRGIEYCVQKKLPISVKDDNGKTPLDYAFDDINNDISIHIAAELIMGGADEVETDFAYFQTALASRNLNTRFDDNQTPLHISSIFGHTAITKYLLENGANTSSQDSSGSTPLHESVRYGNIENTKLLLSAGANVNAKDNLGKTPIMIIIPNDKIFETYSLLLSYKADITQKDMYGDTILHTAAMMNIDSASIELLLKNKVDIDARNKEGVTPLEIAVQKNDILIAKLLTANKANIHTKDTNGNSPLILALNSSNELLEAILNKSNIDLQDSEGNTPLHIALLNNSNLSKIQYIVSFMDDVNTRNRDGNSALFITILKNRQKVGEILLSKNADIFSTNINNNSPLRLALKHGGTIQDWLITSNTINATDGSGNTPLHYATEWQYKDAIISLLSKGANVNAKNANGEIPLFNAVKTNNPDIIKLIIDGGASVNTRDNLGSTLLHMAVRWDALSSIQTLIEQGININAQNSAGKSPLAEASLAGKSNVAEYLIKQGADINSCDTNGVTILMDAIKGQNVDIVKLLLSYGGNPNIQDINGNNAFHEAAYQGNIELIKLIRDSGANALARDKQGNTPFSIVINKDFSIIKEVLNNSLNITDSDGNTPIHIIVTKNASTELLQEIIKEGFPLDTRNSSGYTPLNYAIEKDNLTMATILLENGANPFQMIDKKGNNGVTIALEKKNMKMIESIVKYAGSLSDVQGNTILHYAAKNSSVDILKTLISYGLNINTKNVSGDTPYTIATRWKRSDLLNLLNTDKK